MVFVWPYIVLGTLTVFVGLLGLLNSRNLARSRASSDLLYSILKDEKLKDACLTIALVIKSDDVDLVDFSDSDPEKTKKTKLWLASESNPFLGKVNVRNVDVINDIQHVISYYDFIASGIKRRIYDEEVLRDSLYSRVKFYATNLKPFIDERKKLFKQETLWQDFIKLAERWGKLGPPKKPEDYDFENIGYFEEQINKLVLLSKRTRNNKKVNSTKPLK